MVNRNPVDGAVNIYETTAVQYATIPGTIIVRMWLAEAEYAALVN